MALPSCGTSRIVGSRFGIPAIVQEFSDFFGGIRAKPAKTQFFRIHQERSTEIWQKKLQKCRLLALDTIY
ncbi:MAG: hypothetical protein K0R75_66 [Paenibacillaceae bacterium]|nr:hypothetical protein [Paenibacillaceae bacterium]